MLLHLAEYSFPASKEILSTPTPPVLTAPQPARTPTPTFTHVFRAVASTLGAALVFPGASSIKFGEPLKTPPFLTGVGPVLLAWLWSPVLSALLVTSSFLLIRSLVFRGEDAFHKALWVRPSAFHAQCERQVMLS